MLAVCTYMTKVALDARILDPEAEEFDGGKVALCADKIIEITTNMSPLTKLNSLFILSWNFYCVHAPFS